MKFLTTSAIAALCLLRLASAEEYLRAAAPITALVPNERNLFVRQDGECPEATATPCADGNGCCPRGAACTYSGTRPVCAIPCGDGPRCPGGGCCQEGYVCGITDDYCHKTAAGGGIGGGGGSSSDDDDDLDLDLDDDDDDDDDDIPNVSADPTSDDDFFDDLPTPTKDPALDDLSSSSIETAAHGPTYGADIDLIPDGDLGLSDDDDSSDGPFSGDLDLGSSDSDEDSDEDDEGDGASLLGPSYLGALLAASLMGVFLL
ncbi:hypothetical protein VTN49DRAFT_5491 [Thermomyces lanuginosus]|uniref:uncharacterized protein n=1 Tax=Thermomyces lanuginosus TaxID=5541 RepID=UPI0037424A9E